MSNDEIESAKGIGVIYGAGISSLVSYTYFLVTGQRSALILGFIECGIMIAGAVQSFRAENRPAPSKPPQNRPSG